MDKNQFKKELQRLLNFYSVDNYCNIPDYLLADLLVQHVELLASAVERGRKMIRNMPNS